MSTIRVGNLHEPKLRADRERRAVPGIPGIEITRTGQNIWSAEDEDWVDDGLEKASFPFVKLPVDGVLADLNRNTLTALAWLTPEQRARVRALFATPLDRPWPEEALALEQELGVSIFALQVVTRQGEEELLADHDSRLEKARSYPVDRVENATVESYSAFLVEHSRPPSKGGNTGALHRHSMTIDGKSYSFLALGAKKWVFAGDTVSFSFKTTDGGYRNVLKPSLVTKDKNGAPVVRGDRGSKPTLRTAPARLPASRREQRD
jgi:hypothetical protein